MIKSTYHRRQTYCHATPYYDYIQSPHPICRECKYFKPGKGFLSSDRFTNGLCIKKAKHNIVSGEKVYICAKDERFNGECGIIGRNFVKEHPLKIALREFDILPFIMIATVIYLIVVWMVCIVILSR